MNAIEFITFLLAPIGYVGLCANMGLTTQNRFNKKFLAMNAAIIVIHVFMVWSFRYGWSFAQATRNGYVGFLLFHGALLMIVGSLFVKTAMATRLIVIAFLVVSAGALGAVFRYEVVSLYRIPVILIALAGLGLLCKSYFDKKRIAASN